MMPPEALSVVDRRYILLKQKTPFLFGDGRRHRGVHQCSNFRLTTLWATRRVGTGYNEAPLEEHGKTHRDLVETESQGCVSHEFNPSANGSLTTVNRLRRAAHCGFSVSRMVGTADLSARPEFSLLTSCFVARVRG